MRWTPCLSRGGASRTHIKMQSLTNLPSAPKHNDVCASCRAPVASLPHPPRRPFFGHAATRQSGTCPRGAERKEIRRSSALCSSQHKKANACRQDSALSSSVIFQFEQCPDVNQG
jgi:hypothetical protein